MIAIQINANQLNKLVRTLSHIKNGVPKAIVPALNRSLDKGRTVVKQEIRKNYVIKPGDIPIKVKHAGQSSLMGAIVLHDKMLELRKFNVRGGYRGKPLWAQVRKGGGGVIASGFQASMPSGYHGPFIRKGPPRLPIKKLLAISAPIMASQPNVGPAVNKAMGETLAKRLDHEMKRVLASAGGRG